MTKRKNNPGAGNTGVGKDVTGDRSDPSYTEMPAVENTLDENIVNHRFALTFFKDEYATTSTTARLNAYELKDRIVRASAPKKTGLPWFKGATFGNKRNLPRSRSLRHDKNVLAISALLLDYDGKQMPVEDAVACLMHHGIMGLVYTTPSYTRALPKWRVVLPLSHELPPASHEPLCRAVDSIFGNIFAPESFTLSQAYFYGAVAGSSPPAVTITPGQFIDLAVADIRRSSAFVDAGNAHQQRSLSLMDIDDLLANMTIGNVHLSQRDATAGLINLGWERQTIIEKVIEATQRVPGNEDWDWEEEQVNRVEGLHDSWIDKTRPRETIGSETAPASSEEALALRFADEHGGTTRYVDEWGKWLLFNGSRWVIDKTLAVYNYARIITRDAAIHSNVASQMRAIASAKTHNAILALARCDRALAASIEQWDSDLMLLNTPGGVVELQSGNLREHRAEDYMTKITAVAADSNCPTPIWSAFLDKVTNGDRDYQDFLARVCGYALTGKTVEHAMFFMHGGGGNGKGVFMGTIADILGGYHTTAPTETFVASSNERHPTDLAGLVGARLVTVAETEEGRQWAESKIKNLTGGDDVTARFMRQDFFTFKPQFKLMISGNHKPGLRNVDVAMRRRLHLLPFTVTIPDHEKDPELKAKLKDEWPGILAWMVQGCLDWQRNGLAAPDAVAGATDDYLSDEDSIKQWLDEDYERDPNGWVPVKTLFASWKDWADENGEPHGSGKRFSQRMAAMNFTPERRGGTGRGFRGLRSLSDFQTIRPGSS